jgi:general stress protein 26
MTPHDPVTELHAEFSSPDATPTSWAEGLRQLEKAEVYWLATVRPDGRPHVTPVIALWLDGALYFSTGGTERKAKNLVQNAHCVITTGCNALNEGLDLVLEGDAVPVSDEALLQRMVEGYASKYDWHFTVREGALYGEGGRTVVFQVAPTKGFGYGKGEPFSATRWRF